MREVGFDLYLTKPVSQPELYKRLCQAAGLKAQMNSRLPATTRASSRNSGHGFWWWRTTYQPDGSSGMLKKFGIEIEVAGDGREALRLLEQFQYDLVLMDCQMPVMDGYEATGGCAIPRQRCWITIPRSLR